MGTRLVVDEHGVPGRRVGRGRPGLVGVARRRSEPRSRRITRDRSRRTPLVQRNYVGVSTGSASMSSPDSRRSRTGMKLRTGGTRSKLYGGGGELVAHSSVLPFQGSSPAISPLAQLRTMLTRSKATEKAMRKEENVMIRFVVAHASLA